MTIWKYKFQTEIEMPKYAEIVHVGIQNSDVHLWAKVDPLRSTETRCFSVYGTGHLIPDQALYVGTVFDGPFVWHVFEIKE